MITKTLSVGDKVRTGTDTWPYDLLICRRCIPGGYRYFAVVVGIGGTNKNYSDIGHSYSAIEFNTIEDLTVDLKDATKIRNRAKETRKPKKPIITDKRHGGPYDRGSADAWYNRPYRPHYFTEATYQSQEITQGGMTNKQVAEYKAGFDKGMASGDHKQW